MQRVPTIDANSASVYGDLEVIFDIDESKEDARAELANMALDIDPDDYIMAVGDVTILALTIVRALQRNGRATILRWDAEKQAYRKEEIRT